MLWTISRCKGFHSFQEVSDESPERLGSVAAKKGGLKGGCGRWRHSSAICDKGEQHCGERPNMEVWAGPLAEQDCAAARSQRIEGRCAL